MRSFGGGGGEISNRFTLPDTVPADVGDPSDLVAMADSNDFNVRVRDRMPSHREIVQLSQEQVHYNVAFAQEQEKAKVAEHALTDMAGSFPSLPPSDMLETATITAVVDDAAPTPMESPPTAAPSFASKVSSSNTFFRGKATLSANIECLKDFSIDTFAEDCSTLNAATWNGLTGIQAIGSRKILEVCFATAESMASLQLNGLNTHGRHVVFQPVSPQVTCVTFWNIPLEMPSKEVDGVLQKYGTIKHSFQSKRMLKGRNVRTGARVYYFELKCTVPRSLTIGGKYVKTKYTGQQAHIDEDRADRARVRSEQKRQVAEQEALRRDEEAMEVASAQAQAAAAEEEKELANMSRQHPACHFGPEEDRSSMTLPPDLIAQAMSRGSIQVANKTTDLDDQGNVKPDKVFHKTGGKRTKNRTPLTTKKK